MGFDGSAFVRHVAERLVHEFQFSAGAGTPGLVGAAKEHPARVQLERLMPGGVGVGTGIIVDSGGHVSKQQDIVIYETLCPVFSYNGSPEATYFPIEGVIAVGEVKSTLAKSELTDAIAKSASVKNLRRVAESSPGVNGHPTVPFRNYGSGPSIMGAPHEGFDQNTKWTDQVCTFVLCQRFATGSNALLTNVATSCGESGLASMPSAIVSLESGFITPYRRDLNQMLPAPEEADGWMYFGQPANGFGYLLSLLRLYVAVGRTVDRAHFDRYFRAPGSADEYQPTTHVAL